MFTQSEEFCAICKQKPRVLRQTEQGWICDAGCQIIDSTRIKDTLIDSGDARESLIELPHDGDESPYQNHIKSCVPPSPVDNFPDYDSNDSDLPPPLPIDLDAVRAEKEFPGMRDLMIMMRRQMEPTMLMNDIKSIAMGIFQRIYTYRFNVGKEDELSDEEIDMVWTYARKCFDRKPKDL